MSTALQRYDPGPHQRHHTEPLEPDELAFLERKAGKDRSSYYKVFQLLMVGSFVIPFAGAWYRVADGMPNAFSPIRFFIAAGILLAISAAATYIAYRTYLHKVEQDIKYKTKTVEKSHIMRKVHVTPKGTYHFYIDSPIKISIEVSQADYTLMATGDEVSIEYTTYSKEYLGYF